MGVNLRRIKHFPAGSSLRKASQNSRYSLRCATPRSLLKRTISNRRVAQWEWHYRGLVEPAGFAEAVDQRVAQKNNIVRCKIGIPVRDVNHYSLITLQVFRRRRHAFTSILAAGSRASGQTGSSADEKE